MTSDSKGVRSVVEILDETRRFPHVEQLHDLMEALLEELGLAQRDLTVVLLSDPEMAVRNGHDRGVEGPTDVLSYPTMEPDDSFVPEVVHLGDILISVDTAQRQAEQRGHDLLSEVAVLAAHGLTHLQGFDHQTEEEWDTFHETQDRALDLLRCS